MPTRTKPSGLGRGLGELFQNTDATQGFTDQPAAPMPDGAFFAELPVSSIAPNPRQPRTTFDEDQLAELAESIKDIGLLQPVVVRPLAEDQYELVMGERRLRATKEAGLDTIPAIVRPTEEADLLRDALLENLHRAQLNPLEEAAAYQQLLDDFGCTQEDLSQRIHRSRPQISNTIRLLRLPIPVQRRVAAGVLSAGHARALLALDSPEAMDKLATRIVAEGLSVRATEEAVTLSAPARTPRTSKARADTDPRATEVAADLSEHFDTRVSVSMSRNRGKITIEFAGSDDLDRILAIIDGQTVDL
ncbi:MAG TPA: ParB/RepB/Spo0J family partition protein [Propionibacteriaceae bacterium]|nr:ParB/RepB/Spo0J family partition protein [Propionibacteriaceae bacterium]